MTWNEYAQEKIEQIKSVGETDPEILQAICPHIMHVTGHSTETKLYDNPDKIIKRVLVYYSCEICGKTEKEVLHDAVHSCTSTGFMQFNYPAIKKYTNVKIKKKFLNHI